jgi:hypothetical protein
MQNVGAGAMFNASELPEVSTLAAGVRSAYVFVRQEQVERI